MRPYIYMATAILIVQFGLATLDVEWGYRFVAGFIIGMVVFWFTSLEE